jgi:hypothetical protein
VRCAIIQPSYIPWRGYFDIIRRVDTFVFYDDVQYDKRGWRNRNILKSPHGPLWLTIPVKSQRVQIDRTPIHAIEVDGTAWARRHLDTLRHLYSRSPHFQLLQPWLERTYSRPPRLLADFTIETTKEICAFLGINTRFLRSSHLNAAAESKTSRLISVLTNLGATHYLSGPTARSYLDERLFLEAGITLQWMTYDYRPYEQLYPPYDPRVSILDLLFMTGSEAIEHLAQPSDVARTT